MELLLAVLAGLTVALLTVSLLRRGPVVATIRQRLGALEEDALPPERRSFVERAILPALEGFAMTAAGLMPGGVHRRLRRRLEMADIHLSAGWFLTGWVGLGVLAPFSILAFIVVAIRPMPLLLMLVLGALTIFGGVLPGLWLKRVGASRVEVIDRTLSDAMDLIVTNVEAGVGLQAALINVAEKFHGPLSDELLRAIREIGLGRQRDEALELMARRTGSHEVALFARSVAQAERNGIPIARILRTQASELRERRRQAARERANTFPLRITLLSVVFIFPTLFLIVLGPVALDVMDYFAAR